MKQIYFLLLFSLLAFTGCEKEKDPPPSTNTGCTKTIFECKINGEPFTYYHEYPCNGLSAFYDSVQFGLHIGGSNCSVIFNDFSTVVFESPSVNGLGTFNIKYANVAFRNNEGQSLPHNKVLSGEVNLIYFKEPLNEQNNYQGYARGNFWFTVYGEDTGDTIKITEGKFCVEL